MEFRLTTDLSVMNPTEISFNFDEIKAYLADRTERYRNLLVEENDLANAKKDRANLRKLATALNEQKIAVKKCFMQPYTEFEAKVKELIALCDEPARNIDEQVKAFEAKAKAEKQAELAMWFNQTIGAAGEYVVFTDIFDPKWLNATVSLESAKEQIAEMCERYKTDVEALEGLCETVDGATAVALRRCYKTYKSIAKVISTKNEIQAELEARKEREAAAEKARVEREEAARAAEETVKASQPETEEQPLPFEPTPSEMMPSVEEDLIDISFKVTCTRQQLAALKRFLVSNNITYSKV